VALPFLILAVLALADLLTHPRRVYLPLLSLAPAFAALLLRPALVVLTGCAAMALWYPMASNDMRLGSFSSFVSLATVVGVTAVGAAISAGRRRRQRELADVRAVAAVAERVLLRPTPSRIGQIQLAATYVSATQAARIGGDVYDVITTGTGTRLLIGDVQGKGLPAVQTAAVVLGAFREAAYDAPGLPEIAERIEISLRRQAVAGEYVTAVLMEVPADGATLRILNRGHPPPLLCTGAAARFVEPPEAALPLGLDGLLLPGPVPPPGVLRLRPGDRLLVYTDGISEARDSAGNFYPLEHCGHLLSEGDPQAALERLAADVARHAGGAFDDDAAMVLLCRPPGDGGAG
jgi:serine phosphatase RsbU (regulator of sigma subunit)